MERPTTGSRTGVQSRLGSVQRLAPLVIAVFFWAASLVMNESQANDDELVAKAFKQVTIVDLKRHCATLASDAFEGREAGANGGKAAAAYLQTELRKVPGIKPAGTSGWLQEFAPDYRNVLAVLPGSDPELSSEVIVIGAHYDHVGRGNVTNSNGPFGYIHNGADDNASGTAALLELIDAFSSLTPAPRRTLLFAFWDAEEVGLLGSYHWVRQPTRPLSDVKLTLNIDMLGRLREGKLTVMGWRSASGLRARLQALNPQGDLQFLYSPTVIADSDHYPFYAAGVPCIHFDSCKHDDYHRPSDDADKLNYEGLHRLTEMIFRLSLAAANEATPPKFRREALTEGPPSWMAARAAAPSQLRLGVHFNLKAFQNGVALVEQVNPGSPAQRAGILAGDRITQLAHWSGGDVDDLRTIIRTAKSPLAIRLQRPDADDPVTLNVELGGTPVRLGINWQADPAMPDSIIINQVVPDSPADRAGLKAGDVVMSFAGRAITSEDEFRKHVLTDPSPLSFRVEREGRPQDVSVKLFEPEPQQQ